MLKVFIRDVTVNFHLLQIIWADERADVGEREEETKALSAAETPLKYSKSVISFTIIISTDHYLLILDIDDIIEIRLIVTFVVE